MLPLSTANATSSARTAPHQQSAASAPCAFVLSLQTCESTNPTAAYYDTPHGNVSNCTFAFDVRWGDGGDTPTTLTNPSRRPRSRRRSHLRATRDLHHHSHRQRDRGAVYRKNSVHAFTLLAPPLPAQSTPSFVCVTGPGSSCLQRGAGVPKPGTWDPVPSAWLTSPVVAGCGLSVVELLVAIAAPEGRSRLACACRGTRRCRLFRAVHRKLVLQADGGDAVQGLLRPRQVPCQPPVTAAESAIAGENGLVAWCRDPAEPVPAPAPAGV